MASQSYKVQHDHLREISSVFRMAALNPKSGILKSATVKTSNTNKTIIRSLRIVEQKATIFCHLEVILT